MQQFIFQCGASAELRPFPQLLEIGVKKVQSIQLNSFPKSCADCFRIYHVIEGKFEWCWQTKHKADLRYRSISRAQCSGLEIYVSFQSPTSISRSLIIQDIATMRLFKTKTQADIGIDARKIYVRREGDQFYARKE